MSCLLKIVPKTTEEKVDVDDDIPMYCILGQETDVVFVTKELRQNLATVPILCRYKNTTYTVILSRNLLALILVLLLMVKSFCCKKPHKLILVSYCSGIVSTSDTI